MPLPIWAKNILFLLVYMISGLILTIIIEDLIGGAQLTPLNTAFESAMVSIRNPLLTTVIVWITKLGNPFLFASLAPILSLYLVWKNDTYEAALLLSALAITFLSYTALNSFLQIQRPVSDLYHVEGWSFPSGHATLVTGFFFMVVHIFFDKLRSFMGKTLLVALSVVATFAICFSRVYLGAHWTLDVIAGVALGVLSVSFTILIFNLIFGERRTFRRKIDL